MIEINLIPDVKLELLKAQRNRNLVVSGSILTAIASGGVVALLAFYVFGGQGIASFNLDRTITSENQKLTAVNDLSEMLTLQNQLSQLSEKHDSKLIGSRIFDLISTTSPTGKNEVAVSRIGLSVESKTITLDVEAKNGYEALEVYKKTLQGTTFEYSVDGEKQEPVLVATSITDSDRTFGQDATGSPVLRFSVVFEYAPEFFSPSSEKGKIVSPDKQNATDSSKGVPPSIFTDAVKDEESNQ